MSTWGVRTALHLARARGPLALPYTVPQLSLSSVLLKRTGDLASKFL